MVNKTEKRLLPLDSCRFIFATMVFLHHYTPQFFGSEIFKVFKELHIGVSMFFTLSGFILMWKYAESFTLSKKFYLKRIFRIYPIYLLILGIEVFTGSYSIEIFDVVLQACLLHAPFSSLHILVGPSWSLHAEEMYYLVFPWVQSVLKKNGFWGVIMLVFIFHGLGVLFYFLPWHPLGFYSDSKTVLFFSATGRIFEFVCGMYAAYMYQFFKLRCKYFTFIGLVGILIVIVVLTILSTNTLGVYHPIGTAIHHTLLPMSVSIFLVGIIAESSIFSKVLSWKALALLGNASYAFYLVHTISYAQSLHSMLSLPLFYVALWLISIGLFYLWERPWIKIGAYIIQKYKM